MQKFTSLFLVFLLFSSALRIYLLIRQIRNVRQHRDSVPTPFDSIISIEDHRKAADYTCARNRLGLIDTVFDALFLLGWTVAGGLALVIGFWDRTGFGPVASGTLACLSVFLIASLLNLPLSAYATFSIESRFGFNRTTPLIFVSDLLKGWVLLVLLGGPLIGAILWLMNGMGELWWIYAWVIWSAFTLVLSWAYPTLIAPLFNKFTPLENQSLKTRIEQLLIRCGFKSKGVFVMDGSKRSSHGNAYFTGLGNNKRIVFFDTLVDRLDDPEIEAVLAHELGHFRLRHVRKRLLLGVVSGFVGLALLGWLKTQGWFYTSLGVDTESNAAAFLLFVLIAPVFTFVFTPLGSWLSRKHEFEADAYAVAQSDARQLAQALVKLYRDNATTLTPDPIHSLFYDSHPPAPIRISRLQHAKTNA